MSTMTMKFRSIHLTRILVESRLFKPKSQLNIVSKDLMGLFLVLRITEYKFEIAIVRNQKEYLRNQGEATVLQVTPAENQGQICRIVLYNICIQI